MHRLLARLLHTCPAGLCRLAATALHCCALRAKSWTHRLWCNQMMSSSRAEQAAGMTLHPALSVAGVAGSGSCRTGGDGQCRPHLRPACDSMPQHEVLQ